MANSTSKETIIVEIEKVQNATVVSRDKNFFKAELDQARYLIDYLLKHIINQKDTNTDKINQKDTNTDKRKIDEEDNYFHQHNTIAVLGPRGAGKTVTV